MNLFIIAGSIVRSITNFQDGKIVAGILKIALIPIVIGLSLWWCRFIFNLIVPIGCFILDFFSKIFKRKPNLQAAGKDKVGEVQICLDELGKIENEVNSTLFQNMAFDTIKPHLIRLIKDKEKTIYSIKEDKMTPHNLVLLLITNVTGKLLSSGQYHVYRGMLNMTGTGLLGIWHYAVSELEKSGYYTAEQAKEDNNWIDRQIKEVG